MSNLEPLNVIWRRRTLDLVPEAYFIEHVLLGDIGRPVRTIPVEQIAQAPFLEPALVISMMTELYGYLAEARDRGFRRLMLFHLGDEHGTDDRSAYAHVELVLRNYWFPDIQTEPKVLWVPNGYATGVGPAVPGTRLKASQRSCAGFFAGALKMRTLSHERAMMKAIVERAQLGFDLHFTATARDRLGPAAYAARLANARFALVPGGNSPETIRLYDALEMAAVPIMLHSSFVEAHDALNGPPFLLLNEWGDLPKAYDPFFGTSQRAMARADAMQAEVITWWCRFKRLQQQKIRSAVNAIIKQ